MSTKRPDTQVRTLRGGSSEIITRRLGPGLDIDVAGLTSAGGGEVILLALIVSRRLSAGRSQPGRTDRHGPPVAAVRERGTPPDRSIGRSPLTDRERAVAGLAGQALTNQQIANRLGISPHTVNFHLRQVFRKFGIESRVQLARLVPDRSAAS